MTSSVPAARDWWRSAVVYEIYPRSFADSNSDGIGDIEGVRSRLDYLEQLGIDAIWLTPFYPSPLADGGYDVTDYRNVDPRLGTLDDFDRLVSDAHRHGIRVIVDIVPNHTSDQHPWFREALASAPDGRARARYVFRPLTAGGLPPSDWRSHFGGSAWEPLPDGYAYLHLFSREQPDLNWENEEVREYILDTLRFWADRGVDGFRVDVAHALAKDLSEPLRSQRSLDANLPSDGSDPLYDRDDVHEIYRSWRDLLNQYEPPRMAVAETAVPRDRTHLYARPDELGQVFDFSLLKSPWDGRKYAGTIRRWLKGHEACGGSPTWVLSNHDVHRLASRLAPPPAIASPALRSPRGGPPVAYDDEAGLRRARAAALLLLALPGSPYVYQGEELGLPEVSYLEPQVREDRMGRDGCRVPLPWEPHGTSFGFGANGSWLPQPDLFGKYAVEVQLKDPRSTLNLYRSALRLRRSLQTSDGQLTWVQHEDPDLVHFRRSNGWQCVVNFSTRPVPLPVGDVLLMSEEGSEGVLGGETAAWLAGEP